MERNPLSFERSSDPQPITEEYIQPEIILESKQVDSNRENIEEDAQKIENIRKELKAESSQESAVMSRRNFLRKAVKGAAGVVVGGAVADSIIRPNAQENLENVVELETNSARYKIIYGNHLIETSAKSLDNVDAVLLEDEAEKPEKGDSHFGYIAQYKSIIERAQNDHIPIFRVDVEDYSDVHTSMAGKHFGLPILESYVAGKLLEKRDENDESLLNTHVVKTRRTVMNTIRKSLAGYLLTPLVTLGSGITGSMSEKSLLRKTFRTLNRFNSKFHPELRGKYLHGRNDLIAQKSETIAKGLSAELNKKPTIAIVIGALHIGIEDSLRSSETDRLLRLQDSFGNSLSNHSYINRFDVDNGKVTETNIDDLSLK
ncbi:MAG: twin-arginine translocation signal domain-containing protein [bacterium]|nr:twin-arginine translocation signal domain-containing protein [bacterium]